MGLEATIHYPSVSREEAAYALRDRLVAKGYRADCKFEPRVENVALSFTGARGWRISSWAEVEVEISLMA